MGKLFELQRERHACRANAGRDDLTEELECRTCSAREAAQTLGPSLGGTYRALYSGESSALGFGQRMVVPRDALHELLENPSMVGQLSTPPP